MSPAALSLEKTMMVSSAMSVLFYAVHDLPDPMIHLGDQVRVLAQPIRGRLVEVRVHRLRRVHVREPDIGEERLIGSSLTRYEVGRVLDDQLIEERAHLDIQLSHRRLVATFRPLPDLRGLDPLWPSQWHRTSHTTSSRPRRRCCGSPTTRRSPDRLEADPPYHPDATCQTARSRSRHPRATRRSCTPTASARFPLPCERNLISARPHRLAPRHDRGPRAACTATRRCSC